MKRRYLVIGLLTAAALASTASLLAGLRQALRREPAARSPLDEREAELRHIREVMGDLLAPPIDFNDWPAHLRPRPDLPDADTLRARIKPIERQAWQDIREDRDSRG
jgi:hypothetical protein